MAFEAGPYAWGWGPVGGSSFTNLGIVEESPRLRVAQQFLPVTGDNLGDTVQDVLYRGHNLFLSLVFKEWVPGNLRAFWAFNQSTTGNGIFAEVEDIGCPGASRSVALRATRIGNCPANGGYQYTFLSALIAPNFDLEYALGSELRVLPVQFQLLPVLVGGKPTFYTVVNSDPNH